MVLIDACVRLIPGVMGKECSSAEESFSANLIEYPQFTRPQIWEGLAIPQVLTSGDHRKVDSWRRAESERLTRERRPDLWAAYEGQPLPALPRGPLANPPAQAGEGRVRERGRIGRAKSSPKR
jgi:tRNA (guanine37-N1)-methyltransferase